MSKIICEICNREVKSKSKYTHTDLQLRTCTAKCLYLLQEYEASKDRHKRLTWRYEEMAKIK